MKGTNVNGVLDLNEMSLLMDMLCDLRDLTPKQKVVKDKLKVAYREAIDADRV